MTLNPQVILAPLQELKEKLALQKDVAEQDSMLNSLLEDATAQIQSWCGRFFFVHSYDEIFRLRGYGFQQVVLRHYPCISLDKITLNEQEVDPEYVSVNKDRSIVYFDKRLTSCSHGSEHFSQISYTAGYNEKDMPLALKRACIQLAASTYAQSGRDLLLKSESVAGVGSTSWVVPDATTGGMPAQVAALLEPYRRIGLA